MKSKVGKLNVDQAVPVPVDLSKLRDVVKKMMLLKKMHMILRSKILKIKYLILLTSNTTLNAKINEVKGKIPSIPNFATTTALTAVENKIPNVSNLVKKSDYNTRISETENKITTDHDHDKYITTQDFH